jgi:hypothetical protein
MTDERILAVDLMSILNEAVAANLDGPTPVTFGEILYALRVCAAVVVSEMPVASRAGHIQAHIIQSAEMMGMPLIPMEVDMPEKGSMN